MALYYLPLLVRSDRYFVAKLDADLIHGNRDEIDFNFVAPADDRVLTPLLTIEDPGKVVLNQMAPGDQQDIVLRECRVELHRIGEDLELQIKQTGSFSVMHSKDEQSGLRLDYSQDQKRITLGYYMQQVKPVSVNIYVTFVPEGTESYSARFQFAIVRSAACNRVVIDFGSEASQIGYKNCGPQSSVVQYDILENIISQLNRRDRSRTWRREDFLNHEQGQPLLYRSFYAIRKQLTREGRNRFPFNFSDDIRDDELRLFITRQETAATETTFRDNYEIIPNLKLGIDKSLQLVFEHHTEDYSMHANRKELISALLLRILRLMISTKPDFQQGGIIVTLLVPNIYTHHDVFDLLHALRMHTSDLLASLKIPGDLFIEYETISESDAAFMGYQQTNASNGGLANGEIALVIDCGKGTTDISMVIADEHENYSSFFRTGFAGAGNVISYAFAEDLLTQLLRAIPASNDISVADFIHRYILGQDLTIDVLNFIQLIETQKKKFKEFREIGIMQFAELAEQSFNTERRIGNLYKDQSTLLQYAENILRDRNIRWDDEVTGIIEKATDALVYCILSSIQDVITPDIRKRIRVVLLSGRAFYFEDLKEKLSAGLSRQLGPHAQVKTVSSGRSLNNKNIAVHGAFSGAYKITDFTGIPIDKRDGLSRNNDVLNNNMYLYRGIKIQPGNDILYNTAVVRRNNQQLKAFRNKSVDIFFTRDNIYLRLMENQKVKDVKSLYSILVSMADVYAPLHDMKAISMFPNYQGELPSITTIFEDIKKEKEKAPAVPVRKRSSIFQLFNL